jgi:hypothetical protein
MGVISATAQGLGVFDFYKDGFIFGYLVEMGITDISSFQAESV